MTGSTPLAYGAWRESTLGKITERLERAAILDLAGARSRGDVLDVGCAVGAYAGVLAAAGARVTGVDSSLPAPLAQPLAEHRTRARRSPSSRVTLRAYRSTAEGSISSSS